MSHCAAHSSGTSFLGGTKYIGTIKVMYSVLYHISMTLLQNRNSCRGRGGGVLSSVSSGWPSCTYGEDGPSVLAGTAG